MSFPPWRRELTRPRLRAALSTRSNCQHAAGPDWHRSYQPLLPRPRRGISTVAETSSAGRADVVRIEPGHPRTTSRSRPFLRGRLRSQLWPIRFCPAVTGGFRKLLPTLPEFTPGQEPSRSARGPAFRPAIPLRRCSAATLCPAHSAHGTDRTSPMARCLNCRRSCRSTSPSKGHR